MTSTTISTPRRRARGRHLRRAGNKPGPVARMLTVGLVVALALSMLIAYGTVDNHWYRVVAIRGESMSPTLDRGDLLVMIRPDDIEVGDIAVFEVNGSLVTHRVVGIEPSGVYLTRGDANPSTDRWNPVSVHVVGEHLFHIPLLGNILGPGIGAYLTDRDRAGFDLAASP